MNYDLSNLFKDTFGVVLPKEETPKLSYLGTPILYPITFQSSKYLTALDAGGAAYKTFSDFTLPSSCIADFRISKNIITTKIEPNRVVKEIFGFGDYNINIRGFCLPDPVQKQGFKTVREQEKKIWEWNSIVDTISVEAEQFNSRGIQSLVIENIEFQTLRGQPNKRPFTITAKSTPPTEQNIVIATPSQKPI